MTPKQKEAFDAYEKYGNQRDAAQALGIVQSSFSERLSGARKHLETDPAVQGAMSEVGMQDASVLHSGWIKTDGASLYFQMPNSEESNTSENIADQIADRLNGIVTAPYISRPKQPSSDILNFVPIYDVHLGMRVGSYGTASAVERLSDGVKDVIDRAPCAETLILLNGGDFTEANDNSALTPASNHPLAVDIEFDDLTDVATDITVDIIEYALTKADNVIYHAIKGNHDHAMPLILRQALRQRYRGEGRFTLKDGVEIFTHEWEGNLLAGIHGHQKVSDPSKLALAIAARDRAAWGRTTRGEIWRGHRHNELTVSVAGMRVNQVNPICPAGRYANENLFTGESDVQCVTYKKGGGRKATAVHIYDD